MSVMQNNQDHELGPRRDVLPHNGGLVLFAGIVSLILLPMGLIGICGAIFFGILFAFGAAAGAIAWIRGRTDLVEMQNGTMNRQGLGITRGGTICGIIGAIVNLVLFLCWVGLWSIRYIIAVYA